jgi:FAD/FMN-containing dehydrogenase
VATIPDSHRDLGDLSTLRTVLRGNVLLPGDAGFDQARRPWSLSVDQMARAVVEVADVDDAAALIRYARDEGVTLAAQPIGHGASRAANGAILVRTRRLDEIRVDPASVSARVGAGVSWAPVQAAAAPFGLLALAGSAPDVGVTGYTLGGGLSWFSRKYGWAADSIIAYDGLTADGERFRATPTSEPDLFWALRGGGGDYAIVTALEFTLQRAPALFGGSMQWPIHQTPAVLSTFRAVTATAPDELTVWLNRTRFPESPPTVRIDLTYLGNQDTAQSLLRAFDDIPDRQSDTRRPLRIEEIGSIANEPAAPTPSRYRATLLTSLDDGVLQTLATAPIDPLVNIQVRHLGGALSQPTTTAAGSLPEPYLATFTGLATSPAAATAMQSRVAAYLDALNHVDSDRTPFPFLAPEQTAAHAFSPETLSRLQEIKRHRDPGRVFRSNYPVLA